MIFKGFKLKKLNNKGMSFVELMTAIVILSIIVVPFLHSFVTGANTSSKARITMNATNLAEDAMEYFQANKISDLQGMKDALGNDIFTSTLDGTAINLETNGSFFEDSMSAYTVKVKLDPDAKVEYTGFNDLNVSDMEELKADAVAVYAMLPEADDNAYILYKARNNSVNGDPAAYDTVDEAFFKANLARTITIDLSSRGSISVTDAHGNPTTIKHVAISVTVNYTLPNTLNKGSNNKPVVKNEEKDYSIQKIIYDNSGTNVEFQGVYLMYTPRFLDPVHNPNPDKIVINNPKNLEGTAYIMREATADDALTGVTCNLSNYKATIELRENPSWGVGSVDITDPDNKSALRLRTNLFAEPSVNNFQCKFTPEYTVISSGTTYTIPELSVRRLEGFQTADGRNFNGDANKNRIYGIIVEVYKGTEKVATLTGTKTE